MSSFPLLLALHLDISEFLVCLAMVAKACNPSFWEAGRIARLVKEEKEERRGVGKERGEQERKEGEELLFMSQGGPWVWTFLLFTNQTDSETHRRDTVMCTAQESPSQAHQETTFWGPWPSGGQLSQCWKVDVGCRRGMWGCWCGVGLSGRHQWPLSLAHASMKSHTPMPYRQPTNALIGVSGS